MDSHPGGSRCVWLARLIAGLALSLAGLGLTASPVAAACDGPFPSFRDAVGSAERIVIGDVIAADPDDPGLASRFTLLVRYVLRGDAPRS